MPKTELNFLAYFAELPDPRANRTKKHALADILGVTLCAVVCGADSFEEIQRFGDAREGWLKQYFALPNGIPTTTPSTACWPLSTARSSPSASASGWHSCAPPPG